MRELLRVLAEWLAFFFDDGRYRIVDSDVTESFGNAAITFASDELAWLLVRDRSQIFLRCRSLKMKKESWYSTDVLMRLLTGKRLESAELTEETASWLGDHLAEIEARFSPGELEHTIHELNELQRVRAKELFG